MWEEKGRHSDLRSKFRHERAKVLRGGLRIDGHERGVSGTPPLESPLALDLGCRNSSLEQGIHIGSSRMKDDRHRSRVGRKMPVRIDHVGPGTAEKVASGKSTLETHSPV